MPVFTFDNSYGRLPEAFYTRWLPTPVASPSLIAFNHALAAELGIQSEGLSEERLAQIFSGNKIPEGADPLAIVYSGHQFGNFVPQLGDGRAILLGEVLDQRGIRRDIQFKGSGKTPYSRQGDGRAALGPVIREYIASEAMHALGIRTTRSLAAVTTGEPVFRETALPGAIVTRVAESHVRIGTFEYFTARGELEHVKRLADYVIDRHYPTARLAENPYAFLLESVMEAQAKLVVSWLQVGFIHGVMNTDNMLISGETIDYGPCAFMDHYEPMKVFSSIDRLGRYAFSNQPTIALWNLARLAETLLPLLHNDTNKAISSAELLLEGFSDRFRQYWLGGMRQKLGLESEEQDDLPLIEALLDLMHRGSADYTLTFRTLAQATGPKNEKAFKDLFQTQDGLDEWLNQWRNRISRETSVSNAAALMLRVNPAYIPRNHRIEQAIRAAVTENDFGPMERLQSVLAHPYEEKPQWADYMLPPEPSEAVLQTFCGT